MPDIAETTGFNEVLVGKDRDFVLNRALQACRFFKPIQTTGRLVNYFGDRITADDESQMLVYWEVSQSCYRYLSAGWSRSTTEGGTLSATQMGRCLFKSRGTPALADFSDASLFLDELAQQEKVPVTIRILDEQTNHPLSHVNVLIVPSAGSGQPRRSRRTDGLGQYNVILQQGVYKVKAFGWEKGSACTQSQIVSVLSNGETMDVLLNTTAPSRD